MGNIDRVQPLEANNNQSWCDLEANLEGEKAENAEICCKDCKPGICEKHAGDRIWTAEISEASRIWGLEQAERFLVEDGYDLITQDNQPSIFPGL